MGTSKEKHWWRSKVTAKVGNHRHMAASAVGADHMCVSNCVCPDAALCVCG